MFSGLCLDFLSEPQFLEYNSQSLTYSPYFPHVTLHPALVIICLSTNPLLLDHLQLSGRISILALVSL